MNSGPVPAFALPKLTEPQKRHLIEMLGEKHGQPLYWRPFGSEQRTAAALKAKGLLAGENLTYSDGYQLTDKGRLVALFLESREGGN